MLLTKKKPFKITHMIYRYVNIVVFTCHNNYFYALKQEYKHYEKDIYQKNFTQQY